jgi:hypothetical protein
MSRAHKPQVGITASHARAEARLYDPAPFKPFVRSNYVQQLREFRGEYIVSDLQLSSIMKREGVSVLV